MIEPHYHDYWGNRIETPESTRLVLLAAMGYGDEAADVDIDANAAGLPPVIVMRLGNAQRLPVEAGQWSVELEDGSALRGALTELPLGYHRLTTCSDRHDAACALIVVPAQCYLPRTMHDGRVWALATQLYALRSERNWGIGDFTDLATLAGMAGRAGAGALALNPLHELHPSNPRAASPYSPSSRLFCNVFAIDVESVAELADSPHAQATIANPSFRAELRAARDAPLVDYARVAKIKLGVLEVLHAVFLANHAKRANDARWRAFHHFVRAEGLALERLALYEALAEYFRARDSQCYGWQDWPREYRSPDSPEVTRFAREHRERVDFYRYLQCLARQQLGAAARASRNNGVALYCDLAVGVERNGADAWGDQDAILGNVSLGAPPDPLNRQGQNWGLAPLSPRALRARAYEPFVALLRANMRYAGILRSRPRDGAAPRLLDSARGARVGGCVRSLPASTRCSASSRSRACAIVARSSAKI